MYDNDVNDTTTVNKTNELDNVNSKQHTKRFVKDVCVYFTTLFNEIVDKRINDAKGIEVSRSIIIISKIVKFSMSTLVIDLFHNFWK